MRVLYHRYYGTAARKAGYAVSSHIYRFGTVKPNYKATCHEANTCGEGYRIGNGGVAAAGDDSARGRDEPPGPSAWPHPGYDSARCEKAPVAFRWGIGSLGAVYSCAEFPCAS